MNKPFNKEISDITYEDVKKLIDDGARENINLEFKRELNSTKPDEIGKSIVAFANTEGGWLIFGIEENKDEDKYKVKGIVPKDNKNYTNKITDIIHESINPYLKPDRDYTTKKVEMPDKNKFIYILKVEKHTGNKFYFYKKKMYFRREASSVPLDYNLFQEYLTCPEISQSIDYAKSLNKKLSKLRKDYDSKKRIYRPYLELLKTINSIGSIYPYISSQYSLASLKEKEKELNDLKNEIELLDKEFKIRKTKIDNKYKNLVGL